MIIEKGKIDFFKMPREKRELVCKTASTSLAYQKSICEEDKSLFNAFISFVFFKTSNEEYDDAWAIFITSLGLSGNKIWNSYCSIKWQNKMNMR